MSETQSKQDNTVPETIEIEGVSYDRIKLVQELSKELAKMEPEEYKRILGQVS